MDTSGMNGLGLASCIGRIPDFNKMQEWKRAMEEAVSENLATTSVAEISATTSSQSSSLATAPINQDEGDVDDKVYHVVTTTLRQIIWDEHYLADIEQQLSFEQDTNHQVFQAFSRVLQEVMDMVNFYVSLLYLL